MKKGYTIVQMVGAVLLLVGAMLQITRWEVRCCDVCLRSGDEPL